MTKPRLTCGAVLILVFTKNNDAVFLDFFKKKLNVPCNKSVFPYLKTETAVLQSSGIKLWMCEPVLCWSLFTISSAEPLTLLTGWKCTNNLDKWFCLICMYLTCNTAGKFHFPWKLNGITAAPYSKHTVDAVGINNRYYGNNQNKKRSSLQVALHFAFLNTTQCHFGGSWCKRAWVPPGIRDAETLKNHCCWLKTLSN